MLIPFVIFWMLVLIARGELGRRAIAAFIATWATLLVAMLYSGLSPYIFTIGQIILDIILVILIFRADIPIW